jgi:hypothetical protein
MTDEKKPSTVQEMSRMGNEARNKALSAEERKQIARKAARARWRKAKDKDQ